jgi:hypothetical protein
MSFLVTLVSLWYKYLFRYLSSKYGFRREICFFFTEDKDYMKNFIFAIAVALMVFSQSEAQVINKGLDNPTVEIIEPRNGGGFRGRFVVKVENFSYRPELATNAATEFNIGVDSAGNPLEQNDGHLHGWVFETDKFGNMLRYDQGRPLPFSYLRFYGAGGASVVGDYDKFLYSREDKFPPGRYKAIFQLQQNDHTAALQATAPAFPAIGIVDFKVSRKGAIRDLKQR